ncbi:hypothetical protein C8R46DRAFT_955552 [Mycena filopes]|nr:hypothetical protein C8R46DRAFT_955552 [Mycena filopes]
MTSLTSLLKSNDAPLPSQRLLAEETVRNKQAQLVNLDKVISAVQLTLRNLQADRAELAAEANQYSSVLSPIRRLPAEMISEIFLYFAPVSHFDVLDGTRVTLPWTLGHICRFWRAISLSLGELWSVLDVPRVSANCRAPEFLRDVDDYEKWLTDPPLDACDLREYREGYAIEMALDYITTCLRRSGNRPLSFRFDQQLGSATFPVANTLSKNLLRFHEVAFVDPTNDLVEYLCVESEFSDNLRAIGVVSSWHSYQSLPARLFMNVGNLTDLSLTNVILPLDASLSLPWPQLLRYREQRCTWTSLSQLSAAYGGLVNLRELWWECPRLLFRLAIPDKSFLLPNLRVARFHFDDDGVDLPRTLVMPVLQAFSIETSTRTHFRSCLPTSSPDVKILQLRIDGFLQSNLTYALAMFPEITQLTLDARHGHLISNADVSDLIPMLGQPTLAPHLGILRLSNRSFRNKECQWTTLADMLHARFRPTVHGVTPLRRFDFFTGPCSNDLHVATALTNLGRQNRWDIRVVSEAEFPAWHGTTSS